jgi:hypothetical protein
MGRVILFIIITIGISLPTSAVDVTIIIRVSMPPGVSPYIEWLLAFPGWAPGAKYTLPPDYPGLSGRQGAINQVYGH